MVWRHWAAYSSGVSPPRAEWGRQVLYSFLQSSITTRASVRDPNSVVFNSSSRIRPWLQQSPGAGEPLRRMLESLFHLDFTDSYQVVAGGPIVEFDLVLEGVVEPVIVLTK